MQRLRSLFVVLLAVCMLLPTLTLFSSAQVETPPSVSAKSAVLIEAESGSLVYEKNAHTPMPMASTTKIMTALTALSLAAPETPITATAEAVGIEGSSIYLTEGEALTLEQLLYALLLESANDAAVAIAIGLCGSVTEFANQMNRKAAELGLSYTHFANPHGLDDDAHYTTAYELALITQEALKNPLFCTIVSTRKTTIPHAGEQGARLLINHNKLLRTHKECVGVKTGFTKQSGRCLVSAATQNGVTVIAVTLNAPDDWQDHESLWQYGFSAFDSVLLCAAESITYELAVVGSEFSSVTLCNPDAKSVVLPTHRGDIHRILEIDRFTYAPISAGTVLGRAVFLCDTNQDGVPEEIGAVQLISCTSAQRKVAKKSFWQWLCGLFRRA